MYSVIINQNLPRQRNKGGKDGSELLRFAAQDEKAAVPGHDRLPVETLTEVYEIKGFSYFRSESTFCWAWFACAIIAVDAWLRIWALAMVVVSAE